MIHEMIHVLLFSIVYLAVMFVLCEIERQYRIHKKANQVPRPVYDPLMDYYLQSLEHEAERNGKTGE